MRVRGFAHPGSLGGRDYAWDNGRHYRMESTPSTPTWEEKITGTLSGEYFSTTKPILLHIRGKINPSNIPKNVKYTTVSFVTNLSLIGIPNQGWQTLFEEEVQVIQDELVVFGRETSVDDYGKFSITLAARH